MFKAILYYLLMVAEFCITIFIGGFAVGLYLVFAGIVDDNTNLQQEEFVNMTVAPFVIGICLVSILVLWFTFYRAKFSRFTLGNIIPKRKWKAFVFFTLPMLGFTLCYSGLLSLFGINLDTIMPYSKLYSGWLYQVPLGLTGIFISVFIIFGAIFEELAKSGKKTWVIFLTIFIMIYGPACLTFANKAVSLLAPVLIIGIIQTVYEFWVYTKTRSTILLFLMELVELIPSYYTNNLVCIALCGIGGAFLLGGYTYLQREYKDDLKPCISTESII